MFNCPDPVIPVTFYWGCLTTKYEVISASPRALLLYVSFTQYSLSYINKLIFFMIVSIKEVLMMVLLVYPTK